MLFIVSNVLVAQHKNVFKLPFPGQYVTIDKIIDTLTLQDNTKLALQRLKELEKQAQESQDELCLLNYKRSEIRYRYIRTIGNEKKPALNQLIEDTEKLIKTVDENQYPAMAALLHFQIGNFLDYQKYNYKEQFNHYLKAYDLFKNIPLKLFPYRYYSQYAIALAYYRFEDYEKAIALGEEVEGLFPQKDFNSILTVNLIGLSYLELEKHEQAIRSFQWIFENNQYALNPKAWQGISLCNLGSVYYANRNYTKAIQYLEQGIPILKQEAVIGNLASAAILMAKIYMEQKNSTKAKRYLKLLIGIKDNIKSTNFLYDLNTVMSDYYQLEGNNKLAFYHLQLATVHKDSLDTAANLNKKFKAEFNFEKEKSTMILSQIENKMFNQRIIGILIFLFLLLLLGSVIIYTDRRKLKFKMKQQELLDNNSAMASELKLAYSRLDGYTQNLLLKTQENQKKNSTPKIEQEELVSHLVNETHLYTTEDWNEFRNLFEKAYPSYLLHAREKYPKITAAELRYMAVDKLNLSTNEMALILNITPDAVRKLKKRLSQKITENLNQSFEEFVISLD